MAVQYAFAGIAQTKKAKDKVTIENSYSHEEDGQTPVFLLETMPVINESEIIEAVCEAETAEEVIEDEDVEEEYMAEAEELAKENHASSTYQQGIDDFYQSQAESQKKKLDTIHEYLL